MTRDAIKQALADVAGCEIEEIVETHETLADFEAIHGAGKQTWRNGGPLGFPCLRWDNVQRSKGRPRDTLFVADAGTVRFVHHPDMLR